MTYEISTINELRVQNVLLRRRLGFDEACVILPRRSPIQISMAQPLKTVSLIVVSYPADLSDWGRDRIDTTHFKTYLRTLLSGHNGKQQL